VQIKDRTLLQRVAKGSAWIVASQGVSLVLVFVAQRIILSSLTREQNGTLFFERRMTDLIVSLLVDFGMNAIIIRRTVQQPDMARTILSSAFAFRCFMWIVATGASVAYAFYSGYSGVDVIIWSFYILIAARTTLLRYVLEAPYRTTSRFHFVSLLGIADAVLFTVLIWFWRESLDPSHVITAFAISAIPGFFALFAIDRGQNIHPSFVRWSEIKALVVEAFPVLGAAMLILMHNTSDTFFLERFGSPKDVGILGAVYTTLGPFLIVVPQAISLAMMPEFARFLPGENERRGLLMVTVIRLVVLLSTLVAAIGAPLLPWFIHLLSGDKYAANSLQFFWFLWTGPMVSLLIFTLEVTLTANRRRLNLALAASLFVFSVVFGVIYIPELLSLGAVYSRLATVVVGGAVSLVILRQIIGEQLNLALVLRCAAVFSSGLLLSGILPGWMPSVFASVAAGVGCVAVSFLVGLVRLRDVELVRGFLRRSSTA